ncbi:SDR family NAD(P)-dependent oxidoreductase [Aspergillus foveolatus]|uniref:SDR family NAD(P)-dependent oxidoreductase n=1 Tax=Aspergillus foveolatus TaxID=210207 RepID=UPI003CCD2C2E
MPFTPPAIYPSLYDKTVVVTGGASGIGAATVLLFALQGSKVIFLDIADDTAQKTIDHVTTRANTNAQTSPFKISVRPPIFYHCDITDLDELKATASKILEEHGPVHVLINNAAATGSIARQASLDVTTETWDFNVNANLRHIFFLTQSFIPSMKSAGGGSIVNLGSISWRIPEATTPIYGTCKAAINGLTRIHSREFGTHNIRVNCVMPGAIATVRQRAEVLTDEYRTHVFAQQSLKRDLEPEDVAKVIVFLGSEEASGVTGSCYVVDGGWMGNP